MSLIKDDTGTALVDTGPSPWLEITKGVVQTRGSWAGTLTVQRDCFRNFDTGTGDTGWMMDISDNAGAAVSYTANINLTIDNGAPMKTRIFFTPSDTGANLYYAISGVNPPPY